MKALAVILGTLAAPAAAAAAEPAADPLHACAVITADAERLACYDRLAVRVAPPAPAPVATSSAPPGAPAAAAATPPAPSATATTGALPQQAFGLYDAEHPRPPPAAKSMAARVLEVGTSGGGHMTVTLEGGQLWELEDADPLLAAGDTVTVARGSFGSFLLETPSKRSHRARRLR